MEIRLSDGVGGWGLWGELGSVTGKEESMSQRGVEVVLGRLATDEVLRRRFAVGSRRTLDELEAQGLELTALERDALEGLDVATLQRFAEAIDPRLQKALLVEDGGTR